MNIYIMSRGRAGKVRTWDNLPTEVRPNTFILVPEHEVALYEAAHPEANILAAPPSVKNYSDKVQYILDDCMGDGNEKAIIMDDDLTFSYQIEKEDGTRGLRNILTDAYREEKMPYLIIMLRAALDDAPLVGVHPRQMGHQAPRPFEENGKIVCVQGINRHWIQGLFPDGLKVNQFPILADVVLNASILELGVNNIIITEFCVDWGPCQAEGGCSLTRTPEMQAEACHWLEQRFGPYIKAVEKEAKNGWLGGKRVDFVGQWKRLHRDAPGRARLLDSGTGSDS